MTHIYLIFGVDERRIAPLPRMTAGAQVTAPNPPPEFGLPAPNVHLQHAAHGPHHHGAVDPYGGPPAFQLPPPMPYQYHQAQAPQFPYYPYHPQQFHQLNHTPNYFPPLPAQPGNVVMQDKPNLAAGERKNTTKSRTVTAHNKLLIECQYFSCYAAHIADN